MASSDSSSEQGAEQGAEHGAEQTAEQTARPTVARRAVDTPDFFIHISTQAFVMMMAIAMVTTIGIITIGAGHDGSATAVIAIAMIVMAGVRHHFTVGDGMVIISILSVCHPEAVRRLMATMRG